MLLNIILFFISFIVIWFGAGLTVSSIEDLSHKLNISVFATSFFVLGILTSMPEASIGINSVIDRDPEIFVGNLIGASLVLFVLVIPILAILGKGIKLSNQLGEKKLLFALLVVAAPAFLVADRKVTQTEGLLLIVLYFTLFYFIEKKKGLFEKMRDRLIDGKTHILEDTFKIIFGILLIYYSSIIIVEDTILFSEIMNISPFLISLLLLSIGTNLPELSLAIRSVAMGRKEVALGDYVGSATANTFIFGFLAMINPGEVLVANHFINVLIFMVLGLGLFFYFSRSKNDISRKEGIILLLVYFAFVCIELTV